MRAYFSVYIAPKPRFSRVKRQIRTVIWELLDYWHWFLQRIPLKIGKIQPGFKRLPEVPGECRAERSPLTIQ